jgi:hypothetical protein
MELPSERLGAQQCQLATISIDPFVMTTLAQEEEFKSAAAGFDALFSNDLDGAKQIFSVYSYSGEIAESAKTDDSKIREMTPCFTC